MTEWAGSQRSARLRERLARRLGVECDGCKKDSLRSFQRETTSSRESDAESAMGWLHFRIGMSNRCCQPLCRAPNLLRSLLCCDRFKAIDKAIDFALRQFIVRSWQFDGRPCEVYANRLTTLMNRIEVTSSDALTAQNVASMNAR